MMVQTDSRLIKSNILDYLEKHEHKEILRFITCGSVDDGKSTMIGRLLHDTEQVYEDHLASLIKESEGTGESVDELELALLVDGLQAEREQGITIDVAYRYFCTEHRKYIIADCPGHEQYTRNMATGASTCDAAIILIDAQKGLQPQTRLHMFINVFLGISYVIVAINKMDLVDFDADRFYDIKRDFLEFSSKLNVKHLDFIPMCAKGGDNVVDRSERTPWFKGRTLMEMLEQAPIATKYEFSRFRMPVQRVNRPNSEFRGYSGTMSGGILRPGDRVKVMPSGLVSTVDRIVTMDGDLKEAFPPMSITVTLKDELDVSRGDVLVDPQATPHAVDQFNASVVWMDFKALRKGGRYIIKHAARQVTATVESILHKIDVHSFKELPVDNLEINAIGKCRFVLSSPLVVEPYRKNRALGAFIIIDRLTNLTVGAGLIDDQWESVNNATDLKGDNSEAKAMTTRSSQLLSFAQAAAS